MNELCLQVTSELVLHFLQVIDRRSIPETWSQRSIRGHLFLHNLMSKFTAVRHVIHFRLAQNLNQNYWCRWSSMHSSEISIGTHSPGRRFDYLLFHSQCSSKRHIFYWHWQCQTLSYWQAAFVPSSESALDTSYFTSRYSWNPSDNQVMASEEDSSDGDSMSGSSSCLSNRQDELVPNFFFYKMMGVSLIYYWLLYFVKLTCLWGWRQGDECGGLAEFDSGSSVNYSFSNFSFKVCLYVIWQDCFSR